MVYANNQQDCTKAMKQQSDEVTKQRSNEAME
jgi:hypothetical protein